MPAVLDSVDEQHSSLYSDIVFAALPQAARTYLEGLMKTGTYEYQSEFVRKYIFQGRAEGRIEGRVEGKAQAVLAVLEARGVEVDEDARARIVGCSDADRIEGWLRRAATADSAQDLLD